jgi:hypothetical protein
MFALLIAAAVQAAPVEQKFHMQTNLSHYDVSDPCAGYYMCPLSALAYFNFDPKAEQAYYRKHGYNRNGYCDSRRFAKNGDCVRE